MPPPCSRRASDNESRSRARLYANPFLVVLDEPNANLDSEGEAALQTALRELKARGAIAIIISHRPAVLEQCDKVLVLRNGTQQAFGPRDVIIRKSESPPSSQPVTTSNVALLHEPRWMWGHELKTHQNQDVNSQATRLARRQPGSRGCHPPAERHRLHDDPASVGCFGGWATTSELAGAVIASGTVIVESVDKKVQHPTGGVVKEILVRDGSEVEEGQILVRLDDTVTRSSLGVLRSQFDENVARRARLIAERDLADRITFPDSLILRKNEPSVAAAMNGEEKLFVSRKEARAGQRAQLRERISQSNEEIRGADGAIGRERERD